MDVAMKFEGWREGIKRSVKREGKGRKAFILVGAFLVFASSMVLGSMQMSKWKNVLTIQNNFNNTSVFNETLYENSTFYDIQFYNGTYSDDTAADALKITIADPDNCDEICQKRGTKWSIAYALAGFTLLLLGFNGALLLAGGCVYKTRMIGVFCHSLLTVFNIASLVVSWRFLNSYWGQLASISTMPSKTTSDTTYDENWTYSDDADLIKKLWWAQLISLIVCVFAANIGCCKSKKSDEVMDSIVPDESNKRMLVNTATEGSQRM